MANKFSLHTCTSCTGLSWTNTGPRVRGDKHVANELKRAAQKHSVLLHDLFSAHRVRAKTPGHLTQRKLSSQCRKLPAPVSSVARAPFQTVSQLFQKHHLPGSASQVNQLAKTFQQPKKTHALIARACENNASGHGSAGAMAHQN